MRDGNRPLFSIIVPCFNVEKSLVSTLDTIANQTFTDFETIIIDDGSNDSTLEIATSYSGNINKRIIHQENRGLGGARNTGISNAKGKYIAFLDADDLWFSRKLELVSDLVLNEPSIELVCHDELVVQESTIVSVNRYGPYTTYEDLLFLDNCLSPSAVVVKTSVLAEIGFFLTDRNAHGIEDYDLWLRLALVETKFSYLHEILGAYVLHQSNMISESNFRDRAVYLKEKHFSKLSITDKRLQDKATVSREISAAKNNFSQYLDGGNLCHITAAMYGVFKNIYKTTVIRFIYRLTVNYLYTVFYKIKYGTMFNSDGVAEPIVSFMRKS